MSLSAQDTELKRTFPDILKALQFVVSKLNASYEITKALNFRMKEML